MQLLETIKCLNGKLHNLEFHQARFDQARRHHFPGSKYIRLADSIEIPGHKKDGFFRCRVLYTETIEKIEFLPHHIRNITSLKLVECNDIDYAYKYANRKKLEYLFEQRGGYDDILIVKNGLITDSYTANPVFFDGRQWWTPETTLLAGTQRERYISEGRLKICRITVDDLNKYQCAGLINALQDMDNMPLIDTANIRQPEFGVK